MRGNDEHIALKAVTHDAATRFNDGFDVVPVTELDRMVDKLKRVMKGVSSIGRRKALWLVDEVGRVSNSTAGSDRCRNERCLCEFFFRGARLASRLGMGLDAVRALRCKGHGDGH